MNLTMDIVTALSRATNVSKNYVKRKMQEGAVEIYDKTDTPSVIKDYWFPIEYGKEYKIRIGKKFFRVIME